MRPFLLIVCLLASWPATSQADRLDRAMSVTNVAGMRELANSVFGHIYADSVDVTEFCQGVFEPPGFYFLNISLKSGVLSNEVYVFQGTRDNLRLRAYLPARDWVWRNAKWVDGRLVISEQPYSGIDMSTPKADSLWKPMIELLP